MSDHTINDPLAELETDLKVSPSPEFAAKVRMRVADDVAPVRWGFRWPTLAASAGVLAAVAVAIAWWPDVQTTPAPVAVLVNEAKPLEAPVGAERSAPSRVTRVQPPAATVNAGRRVVQYGNVLVPPDQANALDALLVGMFSGRWSVPTAPDPLVELPELKPKKIAPLRLEPLPDLVDTEGGE